MLCSTMCIRNGRCFFGMLAASVPSRCGYWRGKAPSKTRSYCYESAILLIAKEIPDIISLDLNVSFLLVHIALPRRCPCSHVTCFTHKYIFQMHQLRNDDAQTDVSNAAPAFCVVAICSLVVGRWSLVVGRWSLVVGRSLVGRHWSVRTFRTMSLN